VAEKEGKEKEAIFPLLSSLYGVKKGENIIGKTSLIFGAFGGGGKKGKGGKKKNEASHWFQ